MKIRQKAPPSVPEKSTITANSTDSLENSVHFYEKSVQRFGILVQIQECLSYRYFNKRRPLSSQRPDLAHLTEVRLSFCTIDTSTTK